jgi:hydroxyethylthiazole kinase
MEITADNIWSDIRKIRQTAPLVHNITNFVVMNTTANALLAIGASPVMAHAEQETAQMVDIASALVINIGTLSEHWIKSMLKAALRAKERDIPIILDPVGAGATDYRTQTARELLKSAKPSIIRGNASEIMAILEMDTKTKGVDSIAASHSALDKARQINQIHGSVVCISGKTDYVVGGQDVLKINNGHPMMARVTGMGCTATALCGVFAAINPSLMLASAHAMAVMGIAGEMAAEISPGPGSLQTCFLDTLYRLSLGDIQHFLK